MFKITHLPTGEIKYIHAQTNFEALERALPLFGDYVRTNYKVVRNK